MESFPGSTTSLREELAAANARADAAEANALAVAQERLGERASRERNWDEMKETLAAARRECDLNRAALARHGCHDTECAANRDEDDQFCDCGLTAALAAPAAASGEEARIEADFERLRDVPTMPPDFEDRE